MDKGKIYSFIVTVLKEKCEVEETLNLKTNLEKDLELDSIFLLTLAVEIENHYKIILNENDSNGIETIGDLVSLIDLRRQEIKKGSDANF